MSPLGPVEVVAAPPLSVPESGILAVAPVVDHAEGDSRFANGIAFSPEGTADLELTAFCRGTNEQQTVDLTPDPTGGTFTLSFKGSTTAPIAWNATAAAVDAALEALPPIGPGGVAVTGGPLPALVTVEFTGTQGGQDQPQLTGDGTGLTRDETYNDGVSTLNSTTYTSASAGFKANDVGKGISGTNIPAGTTIAAVVNATTITLSQATTVAGSGLTFTIAARNQPASTVVIATTVGGSSGVGKATGRNRLANVTYEPFAIIGRDSCGTFGWQAADYEGRARRALASRESEAIEREFWEGTLVPTNPRLGQATGTTVLAAGGLRRSLARLSQALADGNAGRGFIHARPYLVELWWGFGLLRLDGGRLVTGTGHFVIAGTGYTGTGPNDEARTDAAEWAYATDAFVVHRGPVGIVPDADDERQRIAQATDKTTNLVEFRAERAVGLAWARTVHAAIAVDSTVE